MTSSKPTSQALRRLEAMRAFMAENTSKVEIAPPEVLDTGGMWVFYDHARFTIFEDGNFGSWPYGPQMLYGLKVGEIKRPRVVSELPKAA